MTNKEEDLRFIAELRESEPSGPFVDQEPLVDLLVERGVQAERQRVLGRPSLPGRNVGTKAMVALFTCTALLVIAIVLQNQYVAEQGAFESTVSDATAGVVQEIAQETAAGETRVDPFEGWTQDQLVAKLAELEREAILIEDRIWDQRRSSELARRFANPLSDTKRAVLRGSEALWLAAETASSEDGRSTHAAMLRRLYPESAAAGRLEK